MCQVVQIRSAVGHHPPGLIKFLHVALPASSQGPFKCTAYEAPTDLLQRRGGLRADACAALPADVSAANVREQSLAQRSHGRQGRQRITY